MDDIIDLSNRVHKLNQQWWHDAAGQPLQRNPGELIALVHSELSEGYMGWLSKEQDDHLPDHPMVHVELVDAYIRILDYVGGFGLQDQIQEPYRAAIATVSPYRNTFYDMSGHETFARLQSMASSWLEYTRKNDQEAALIAIACLMISILQFAQVIGLGHTAFMDCLEEKLFYNQQRADHKLANRLLAGGKKF